MCVHQYKRRCNLVYIVLALVGDTELTTHSVVAHSRGQELTVGLTARD